MTAAALLLRPLGIGLARRVALVLAVLFMLVLVLSWLAVHMLSAAVPPTPSAAQAVREAGGAPPSLSPPAATLAFHVAQRDPAAAPAPLLDASSRQLMLDWNALLRARPDTRVILTLACAEATPAASQRHIGAALVRQLAGDDLNPHRVQLTLAGSGGTAMSPGDFRITLELAPP